MKIIKVKLKGTEPVTLTKEESEKVYAGKARICVESNPDANKGIITLSNETAHVRNDLANIEVISGFF